MALCPALGGGAVMEFANLLRYRLKLSPDAAFAVFAAALLVPSLVVVLLALALALALAAGVTRSRLLLRRHTGQEVLVGLLAGTAAGIGFHFSVAWSTNPGLAGAP